MKKEYNILTLALRVIGAFLSIIIWVLAKKVFDIPDRILPSICDVFNAVDDFEPSLVIHTLSTISRLIIGYLGGIVFGIIIGMTIYKYKYLNQLFHPALQSLRAVPPIATVPFFILWFGFSETGRYFLVISGIGFNIAVSTYQILSFVPERYEVVFRSFRKRAGNLLFSYLIPRILEELLPTVRFSLSIAIGLVIVSELLGAQIGLGYLIQTSRSTYSMHVIFLCMILLGIINFSFDKLISYLWQKLTFWKK